MSTASSLFKSFWSPQLSQMQRQHVFPKIRSTLASNLSPLACGFFASAKGAVSLLLAKSAGRCFLGCFVRHFRSSNIQLKWQTGVLCFDRKCCSRYDANKKFLPFAMDKRDVNTQIPVNIPVIFEESLVVSPEIQALAGQLQNDGQMLVNLKIGNYKPAESANEAELSILLCNDKYIQKLNKQWLRKDRPTDVLSFPTNEIPNLSSLLLLGDIVISLDTAKLQAEERQHSLLDEVRILMPGKWKRKSSEF